MASDWIILIPIIEGLIVGAMLVYAAYWAFSIRRALKVGYYRGQAFWAGTICLYLIFSGSSLYFIPTIPDTPFGNLIIIGYYTLLPILFLGWADSSVRISRRSDPLLRDTFRWKRLRVLVWVLATSSASAIFIILGASFFLPTNTSPFVSSLVTFPQIATNLSIILPAVPALLLSARRSMDPVYRRSLEWFGLFGLTYFLIFVWYLSAVFLVGFANYPNPNIVLPEVTIGYFLNGIGAYFLYRSAKSLAPLNRISIEQSATTLGSPT